MDRRQRSLHAIAPRFETNDEGKAIVAAAISDLIERNAVSVYAFMVEAWIGGDEHTRPSEDPERTECLVLGAVDRFGQRRVGMIPIERQGESGEARLGAFEDWTDSDQARSWMLDLFGEQRHRLQ